MNSPHTPPTPREAKRQVKWKKPGPIRALVTWGQTPELPHIHENRATENAKPDGKGWRLGWDQHASNSPEYSCKGPSPGEKKLCRSWAWFSPACSVAHHSAGRHTLPPTRMNRFPGIAGWFFTAASGHRLGFRKEKGGETLAVQASGQHPGEPLIFIYLWLHQVVLSGHGLPSSCGARTPECTASVVAASSLSSWGWQA